MVFQKNKWQLSLALIGALSVVVPHTYAATTSACEETTVGRPLKGFELPKNARNSNDIIAVLGAPFFATYLAEERKDVLVYVDGYFRGEKKVMNSADPTLYEGYSSSQEGCGVALIFTFSPAGMVFKITALKIADMTKAHASKFADTTWATAAKE
ncbi:hypothetical protein JAB5_01100 [Janthinobacterium sp. HH103]|uniref:Uncharacterized protein n=1 Tax=Janthinobacterium agaricidamnosum TaxID=55508 RepID=A0A3G2E863_9BURK|nr:MULTISPECIES: hypothetical protein [Janthinobacterium]AYM76257.1 hypothetical protein D9M09_10995 [Janthinobacterium agaricidamnosum]OEZ64271.1 hypothetical protein JAB2_42550 [Janthinobacterium sp. HH100]OEZ89024.1 hypothetical protein JAB5_01100 [Janthinobacterium sp. HH103]QOU73433.1 hypothetical protein JAB4_028880 [Janthinobacterium sp. HH102]